MIVVRALIIKAGSGPDQEDGVELERGCLHIEDGVIGHFGLVGVGQKLHKAVLRVKQQDDGRHDLLRPPPVAREGEFSVGEGEFSVGEGEFSVGGGEFSVGEGEFSVGEGEFSVEEGEFSVGEGEFSVGEGEFSGLKTAKGRRARRSTP
eukprot:738309-Prorocentrum_minimum.AAC.6